MYEQRSSFGGLWNYSSETPDGKVDIPQTNPNQPQEEPSWSDEAKREPHLPSPMYEGLETNIPHFLMEFSDAPTFRQNQLFPSREATLQYLQEYAADVKDLVKFQTQVLEVIRDVKDSKCSWLVKSKNLQSKQVDQTRYDAVVVASGHYTVPYIPDIPGIREWNQKYPNIISHSKNYRRSQNFANRKVVIVGYSASGRDISSQIAIHSQLPVLVSQRSDHPIDYDPTHLTAIPEITEFLPRCVQERALRLKNGDIEADIDAIIFCTGYYYSYPFLSSFQPQLIKTGERVQNLYRHIFSIDHPTLAFVGLPKPIVPFRTCEGQAAVIARVWSDRLDLPSRLDMHRWERDVIARQGNGKRFHDLGNLGDFDYHDDLVELALLAREGTVGKFSGKWSQRDRWTRKRCGVIKQAFAQRGEARHMITTMEELGFCYEI